MHSERDLLHLANTLLCPLHLEATACEVLQPLWADYGSISRLAISPQSTPPASKSLILKSITPPPVKGSSPSESHLRKLISYEVEQYFYTKLVPHLPASTPVAQCVASSASTENLDPGITTILTDLREDFPIAAEEQRSELSTSQVHAALDWLANFHGFWWARNTELRSPARLRLPPLEEQAVESSTGPVGVWLNGGYTYLATRQSEYKSLQDSTNSPWRQLLCSSLSNAPNNGSLAELIAAILAPASSNTTTPTSPYETLLHGDVKSANLFTTESASSSSSAAFFDFQYVGLGLGVCDLAKLFTCSVPESMLTASADGSVGRLEGRNAKLEMRRGERTLLERYRRTCEEVSGKKYPWLELERHWNCALVDWLRFQAGWGFWGNTSWLEARVRLILDDQDWLGWVRATAADALEANAWT